MTLTPKIVATPPPPPLNNDTSLKVLLHCAILSATCLAMFENVAFQVAEVWYRGPVTLCNFFSKLSRNASRNERQEVCACALVKTVVKLPHTLLEG